MRRQREVNDMRPAIAPSVLTFPHADLKGPLLAMQDAGVDLIHLDVMDGQFVPPITFGDGLAKSVVGIVDLPVEAHLMIETPEKQIDAFAKAGCFRLIAHVEATVHSHRLMQQIKDAGMEAGIAINPGTPVEAIMPILTLVDLVLVMTVNPGYGGQKFLPECLEKVQKIRHLRPEVFIEVDGGIEPLTIKRAQDAGANLFVVGSYLQKPASIQEAVEVLEKSCGYVR